MAIDAVTVRRQEKVHLWLGLLGVLLILMLAGPMPVRGHASLLNSTPTDGAVLDSPPTEIVLEFSEPVGLVDGGTTLHGGDRSPLELVPRSSGNQMIIPLDELVEEGSYIVQWRVISADSHPITGTLSFTVGLTETFGSISIEEGLPGWVESGRTASVALKYVGLLASLGVLLVGWMVVRNDLSNVNRLAAFLSIPALAGMLLELPLAAMIQRGTLISSPGPLWEAIANLNPGTLLAGIIGIAAISAALMLRLTRSSEQRHWRFTVALITIATLTLLLSGHTRTREPTWLMMLADAVHLFVGALWLGGVILLTLGLRGWWGGKGFSTPDKSITAVARFSSLAGYTAALVVTSGAAMAVIVLESIDALWRTSYGTTLLIKIGMVVLVIILAAINRYRLLPRVRQSGNRAENALRRLVAAEFVLLMAVVVVTSSLVHQNPNVVADSPSTFETVLYEDETPLDEDHTLRLKVEAGAANEIIVTGTIIDESRNIVLPDADLQLSWYLPAQDLGPLRQEIPIDPTTGAYQGIVSLPTSGEWELGIQVRIDRFTDSRTTISIMIPD